MCCSETLRAATIMVKRKIQMTLTRTSRIETNTPTEFSQKKYVA